MPPPSSLQRRLPALGHALSRVFAAMDTLGKRMARGTLPRDATELLQAATAKAMPPTQTLFCGWRERTWQIVGSGLSMNESAPEALTAMLPVSLLLACALLHLPGLRQAMRRELRYARYDRLARVLPRVWWVTNDTLPPGSVIAGLGITAWNELPKVLAQGRRFAWVIVDAKGREIARAEVSGSLPPLAEQEIMLLVECSTQQPFDGWVQASYGPVEAGRWTMNAAQQWQPEAQRWSEWEGQRKTGVMAA